MWVLIIQRRGNERIVIDYQWYLLVNLFFVFFCVYYTVSV